jgi:hypothetical protein
VIGYGHAIHEEDNFHGHYSAPGRMFASEDIQLCEAAAGKYNTPINPAAA